MESFTVTFNDGHGGIVTKQVDVTVTGTNDAPILASAAATGTVTEQTPPTGNLSSTGSLNFRDVDLADVHAVSATAIGTPFGTLTATKAVDTTGSGGRWFHQLELRHRRQRGGVISPLGQTRVESFTVGLG